MLAWEKAELFPTKAYVDQMNALRARARAPFRARPRPAPIPSRALADPQVWELLRKIAAHKKLRDEVAKLAEKYPDPAAD